MMRARASWIVLGTAALVLAVTLVHGTNPPSWVEASDTPSDEAFFDPSSSLFEKKSPPDVSDWLAQHDEPGQTFLQYRQARPNALDEQRSKIYILPLGDFPEGGELLETIEAYAETYFGAEAVVEEARALVDGMGVRSRIHPATNAPQLLTPDILALLRRDLPEDAYCRIAVTMTDLYPDPAWNFVFGQASITHRVGVFSFARYGTDDPALFTRRCLQVFSHETGHMFGIRHCVAYQCLMNGSNHLGESDATPLHLCPVCLKKLHHNAQFRLLDRYVDLRSFYRKQNLSAEEEWIDQRLGELRGRGE